MHEKLTICDGIISFWFKSLRSDSLIPHENEIVGHPFNISLQYVVEMMEVAGNRDRTGTHLCM